MDLQIKVVYPEDWLLSCEDVCVYVCVCGGQGQGMGGATSLGTAMSTRVVDNYPQLCCPKERQDPKFISGSQSEQPFLICD